MNARFFNRLGHKLSLFFFCLLLGCSNDAKNSPVARTVRVTYDSELAAMNAAIAKASALVPTRANDNLLALELVTLLTERARLAGDYNDYTAAEALLNTVNARSAPTSLPCLAQAKLHLSLHRLPAATSALDACPTTVSKAEIGGLRADIAFYSGRYTEAGQAYAALVNQVGMPQDYVRFALFKSKMGAPGEAAALIEAAEKRYHGNAATMHAWFKLQRAGIAVERGNLDEALALFHLAADALPGWWQTDDLIAELKRVRGDGDQNAPLAPDQIHTLKPARPAACRSPSCKAEAAAEAKLEQEAQIKKLALQARTIDDTTLERFPEAVAGHMLNHLLKAGLDPRKAMALAQMNFIARPYGDAAIALARAELANGNPARALAILKKQQADGWDNAELYWVTREAFLKLDQKEAAETAQAQALRRNPASAVLYGSRYFAPP